MAKLNAKNPLTGSNMDLSLKGIGGLFIGALVLWWVAATSQGVGKMITNRFNNRYIDLVPDPISSGEATVKDNTVYYGN